MRGRQRAVEVFPVRDGASVDGADPVTALQAGGGRRTVVRDPSHDGRPDGTPHGRQDDAEDDRRQHEVHPGAGEHDQESRPEGLERERLLGIEDGRTGSFQRILFPHHLHVAAHRDGGQAVFRLLAAPSRQHRPEPDREPLDSHPGPAGDQEVSELVDQDEDADDDDEGKDGGHAGRPPCRTSIDRCTARRVSRITRPRSTR